MQTLSPNLAGPEKGAYDSNKQSQNMVSPQSLVTDQIPDQFEDAADEQHPKGPKVGKSPTESRIAEPTPSQPNPSSKGAAYDWFDLGYVHSQSTNKHLTSSPINPNNLQNIEGEVDILELTIQQESIDFPDSGLTSHVTNNTVSTAPVFNKTFTGQSDLSNLPSQNTTLTLPPPKLKPQSEAHPLPLAPSYMKKAGASKVKKQATISELIKMHRNNAYFHTHVKNKKSTKNKVTKEKNQGPLQDTQVQTQSSTSSAVTPQKPISKAVKTKLQGHIQKKNSKLVNPYLKSKQRVKPKKDNKG